MFRVLLLCVVIGFCCINSSKCDFVDLPVAELCFSCICRASGCVLSCDSRECGPFRITKEYWMASGNWTYNNHPPEAHQSFIKCATNFYCSVITVQEYMKKFKKDCNGDGKVNCDDFAAIHVLGPDLCHTPWPKRYKQDFELCKAEFISSTTRIDEPVSIRCINCLCQAATACNLKGICRGELCGPFGITKNYWLEANSPTVHRVASTDPAAFETCMGSAFCNYFVLQRYMEKYKKDCNGDGKIDCDDFAAILRLGPEKCDGELPENYQDRYDYCQALVQD